MINNFHSTFSAGIQRRFTDRSLFIAWGNFSCLENEDTGDHESRQKLLGGERFSEVTFKGRTG